MHASSCRREADAVTPDFCSCTVTHVFKEFHHHHHHHLHHQYQLQQAVTGGGRGIGAAIALALAKQGASLALVARTEQQLLEVRPLYSCTLCAAIRFAGRMHCADIRSLSAASQSPQLMGADGEEVRGGRCHERLDALDGPHQLRFARAAHLQPAGQARRHRHPGEQRW